MQKTLTFTEGKKKYVSKPFDFETLCKINDAHSDETRNGALNICRDAVDYMFEGTEATQDVINKMDMATRAQMCLALWQWYIDVLTVKNE